MYTIWRTDHIINEKVTQALRWGSQKLSPDNGFPIKHVSLYDPEKRAVPSISYGILRGTGNIFKHCQSTNTEWWELDRGYFRASVHEKNQFDGYYRISAYGTRAGYCEIDVSSDRLARLNIEIKPWSNKSDGHIIYVPPTQAVKEFYGPLCEQWEQDAQWTLKNTGRRIIYSQKTDTLPVKAYFDGAYCLVTFNSNSAIDALAAGIPAITWSPDVFDWNLKTLHDIETDLMAFDREKLFRFLSYNQFTLDEFRAGYAWETAHSIQKYGAL